MSKFLIVCKRHRSEPLPADLVGQVTKRIQPDNIRPRPPLVHSADGSTLAVTNPTPALTFESTAFCLGQLFGDPGAWQRPGAPLPDGTYTICRADEDVVELATDAVATRQTWYAITDEVFVASSSQRAIVSVLGGFEPNPQAIAWMLSSGTLGPESSWDRRLSRLPGEGRLRLRRDAWELERHVVPIEFDALPLSAAEHEQRLRGTLEAVVNDLSLDLERWRLPLSGGYDSRALLLMLRSRPGLQCMTWGLGASLDQPRNDAYVARQLANSLGVPHSYHLTDYSEEPPDTLVTRFLVNGEGVVDSISAYMDGFQIWRELHESGVEGAIRGDEGFGWQEVISEHDVRRSVECTLLSDFFAPEQLDRLELPAQVWPEPMHRRPNESLSTWRDRLYHGYRIPVVLAALTELKTNYLEVVNPLLSRRLVELARTMPDRLRTEKALFRRVVQSMSPPVPYAKYPAIADRGDLMQTPHFLQWLHEQLESARGGNALPDALIAYATTRLPAHTTAAPRGRPFKSRVKQLLPPRAKQLLRGAGLGPAPVIPGGLLAFRVALIARMHAMLAEDGRWLREMSSEHTPIKRNDCSPSS